MEAAKWVYMFIINILLAQHMQMTDIKNLQMLIVLVLLASIHIAMNGYSTYMYTCNT